VLPHLYQIGPHIGTGSNAEVASNKFNVENYLYQTIYKPRFKSLRRVIYDF